MYKAIVEGKVDHEDLSALVARFTNKDGHGHVIFYRGYNNPDAIAKPGSVWNLSEVRELSSGEILVTNRPLQYNAEQTMLHVIIHEFEGHGYERLLGDHFSEIMADELARQRMHEYGFIK